MSNAGEDKEPAAQPGGSIAAAIRRAEIALQNVKRALKEENLEDLSAKAAEAAATLIKEGEALIGESETLTRAQTELTGAVRRHPLAALGVAFGAGLLLALLTRG
jgi:hypothetical protein